MASAMFSLKKFGKGLPMNAYPPVLFVKKGPYRFLRHPIYWGYCMLMTGVFISIGSAGGLWIVTPMSVLAIIALVLGYENIDLKDRFKDADMSVLLDIPSSADSFPSLVKRIVSLFWVIAFLITSNYVVWFLTHDSTSILSCCIPFPQRWDVCRILIEAIKPLSFFIWISEEITNHFVKLVFKINRC